MASGAPTYGAHITGNLKVMLWPTENLGFSYYSKFSISTLLVCPNKMNVYDSLLQRAKDKCAYTTCGVKVVPPGKLKKLQLF